MEEVVLTATLRDQVSSQLKKVTSQVDSLRTVGGKLNETIKNSSTGFKGFASNLKLTSDQMDMMSDKIGKLGDAITDKLVYALKRGAAGMIALGSGASAMVMTVTKEIQNAQLTIGTYMGGNNPTASTGLVNQMRYYSDIVSLSDQTSGMKQLLVNPQYHGQAQTTNAAIMRLAAASGSNASGVATSLYDMLGRAEQQGHVSGRVSMLLGQAGVNMSTLYQSLGINPNSPQAAEMAQQLMGQITTPQQLLNFIDQQSNTSQFKNTVGAYRGTLSGSVGNLKKNVQEDVINSSGALGKELPDMIKTLTQVINQLLDKVGPPLVKFLQQLMLSFQKLLPLLTPIIAALAQGFIGLLKDLTPLLVKLQPVAKQLTAATAEFFNAMIKVLPEFIPAMITIAGMLPMFVKTLAQMVPLVNLVIVPLLKLLNAILKVPGVGMMFASFAAAIVLFSGLNEARKSIMDIYNAFKEFQKLGIKEALTKGTTSELSENTAALTRLTEAITGTDAEGGTVLAGAGKGAGEKAGGEGAIMDEVGGASAFTTFITSAIPIVLGVLAVSTVFDALLGSSTAKKFQHAVQDAGGFATPKASASPTTLFKALYHAQNPDEVHQIVSSSLDVLTAGFHVWGGTSNPNAAQVKEIEAQIKSRYPNFNPSSKQNQSIEKELASGKFVIGTLVINHQGVIDEKSLVKVTKKGLKAKLHEDATRGQVQSRNAWRPVKY